MVATQRILFPVDYSDYPFAVSPAVGSLIARPNVEVVLLHIIEADKSQPAGFANRMQMLDGLARRYFPHCSVRKRVDHGSPELRILNYIRENDIDIVITSARDSGGFGKGPLGRVASRVLREASCPVWLEWRTEATQFTAPAVSARRVCCAVDGVKSDEQLLHDAAGFTDRLGADLTIIAPVQPGSNEPRTNREIFRENERIDKLRRRTAPRAEVVVAAGWREGVISRTIREQHASLLITGDCRRSVIAAEPGCPVLRLTYPPAGAMHLASVAGAEYRRVARC